MTFLEKSYIYVENSIEQNILKILYQYSIFDRRLNYQEESNIQQVPGSHYKYGDPLMESLLIHMKPIIENNTGLKLLPTYSYYRVYKKGNDLKPHTDRPACEISASLCLGYTDDSVQWPLYVEDKPFIMKPGDMIIYRGMELNHYRYPLECDYSWSQSQVFLHYVDANGPHADQKFDGRNDLGTLKSR